MNRPSILFWPILAAALVFVSAPPRGAFGAPVLVTEHEGYVLYEPDPGASFRAATMPLVVYLHGAPWLLDPESYDRLLTDLAAAGCTVVLPLYYEPDWNDPRFWPDRWYATAVERTRAALLDVSKGRAGSWRPPLTNLALVGHSLGGAYAMKMADEAQNASLAANRRLPASPRLVVLHDAAGFRTLPWTAQQPYDPQWFASLDGIRDDASLVVVGSLESVIAHLFGQDTNATGIWSRAWNRSGPLASKRGYVAHGGHFDVYGTGDYLLYRNVTVRALRATFAGGSTNDPAPDRRMDTWLDILRL